MSTQADIHLVFCFYTRFENKVTKTKKIPKYTYYFQACYRKPIFGFWPDH